MEDGRAADSTGRQVTQCHIGVVEGVRLGLDPSTDTGCDGEELRAIASGIGGHAAQRPFAEQVLGVAQLRDVGEMDARDDQCPTLFECR